MRGAGSRHTAFGEKATLVDHKSVAVGTSLSGSSAPPLSASVRLATVPTIRDSEYSCPLRAGRRFVRPLRSPTGSYEGYIRRCTT